MSRSPKDPMDPDRIDREWRERQNAELACRLSREVLDALSTLEMPFSAKFALLGSAAEAMLDAPDGDPLLVYRKANALSKELQEEALMGHILYPKLLERRVVLTKFKARGLHCGGRSRSAFAQVLAAHTRLEVEAGGRDELLEILGRSHNALASALIEIVGVGCASLRRAFEPDDPTRLLWMGEFRAIVDALIPDHDVAAAPVYPGSPSCVQAFFMFVEAADPDDVDRIEALYAYDQRVRPTDRRGQATIPLRDAAYAKHHGDTAAFERHAAAAPDRLRVQGLGRHLVVVEERGYLKKAG